MKNIIDEQTSATTQLPDGLKLTIGSIVYGVSIALSKISIVVLWPTVWQDLLENMETIIGIQIHGKQYRLFFLNP